MVTWPSCNSIGNINELTLHEALLIVTMVNAVTVIQESELKKAQW